MGYPVPIELPTCDDCVAGGAEYCSTELRPGESFCSDFDPYVRYVEECGRWRWIFNPSCDPPYCMYELQPGITWYPGPIDGYCQTYGGFEYIGNVHLDSVDNSPTLLAHTYALAPIDGLFAESVIVDNQRSWCGLRSGDRRVRVLIKRDLTQSPP